MATLEERKVAGLVECRIGIKNRDQAQALAGIDEFLNAAMTEMELDSMADEAEVWDDYFMNNVVEEAYNGDYRK